ncbi:hypothetical protein AVEN_57116-1 [Araneus ventricosus]|uniref:Uncharacterized protein n=1 Tax=Araneus ventricosus TaxID=182803 RepID=A0A4Y2HAJ8_ARAVE|nr:hypothetical protein AVEN_57116-1 [Araneus ventricosus]
MRLSDGSIRTSVVILLWDHSPNFSNAPCIKRVKNEHSIRPRGESRIRFSLVILTSRFEAARGLFWDGPRNFEPRSDVEGDIPNFHATPTGGPLDTTYDLACNLSHTWRIFSGISFRTWKPPAPKPRPCH